MNFDRANTSRKLILEATKVLLEEGGANAVSMRSIANAIGVSAMMPYKHFPSKDHILMELRLEAFDHLRNRMQRRLGNVGDPRDALVQVSKEYIQFGLEHPNEYRLMFDPWEFEGYDQIQSDFGESVNRETQSWQVNLDVVTAYCLSENLDVAPRLAAHSLWSSLHGALQLHLSRKLVFGVEIQNLTKSICENAPGLIRAMCKKLA